MLINESEFNELSKNQIETIYQHQKMVSIGYLSEGIAHEIMNPLTGVLICSEILLLCDEFEFSNEQLKQSAEQIRRAALQIKDVIERLQKFALVEENNFKNINLNEVLNDAMRLMITKISHSNIDIIKDIPDIPLIKGRFQHIQAAFINIIDNAVNSLEKKNINNKILEIKIRPNSEYIRIIFKDNGIGISEENLKKVMEPFFTTDRPKYTGLGLSTCQNIFLQHNGNMEIKSSENEWTCVIIDIPNRRIGDE